MSEHSQKERETNKTTVAYLGPRGTFTEMAVHKAVEGMENSILVQTQSISDIFAMVASGEVDQGTVPIENSTAGHVADTVKGLSNFDGVFVGEVMLPISHSIYYQHPETLRTVASKDQALAQCDTHLKRHYSRLARLPVDSTSQAVLMASQDPSIAAIASRIAADALGLKNLHRRDSIEDNPMNATRFVTIARHAEIPPITGNDKTALMVDVHDEPGSLYSLLEALGRNNINLTQIKSLVADDGSVKFLMSLDGHMREKHMSEMISVMQHEANVRLFGSYAKAEYKSGFTHIKTPETYMESVTKQLIAEKEKRNPDDATIVFTLQDRPGALALTLQPFAQRGINLTHIDSLPTGKMGEYAFHLSFKNGQGEHHEIIEEVRRVSAQLVEIPV